MQLLGTGLDLRLIAWNGIHLKIPTSWEDRVSGQRHLIFENDFQPQLQIRWERLVHDSTDKLQKRLAQFAAQMGSNIVEDNLPAELQPLKDKFGLVTCYQDESGMVKGGICLCAACYTMVLFQLLSAEPTLLREVGACLTTFSCHDHAETLWRIQDFSLTIPVSYILKDYTFGAGLTRLSFRSSEILLQTCKIGPADTRLSRQSLTEILITLTDTPDMEIVTGEDNSFCEGQRSPTIPKQIFFRLRREKPFIRAKIWHDTVHNRLLAVVLSSNRPIPLTTTLKICNQYEIIQKENRTSRTA